MQGPLSAAIAREAGVPTEPRTNPLVTSVGTSIVKIVPQNANRFSLLIVNLGTANMYIAPDNAPSATRGIIIPPNGGTFSANWRDDQYLPAWEFFAIADAAAQAIFVMEVVAR